MLCDLLDTLSIQIELRHYLEFQKLYLASCKSIDLDCRGKTQQSGNLLCCSQLRIDDHGHAKALLDKADLLAVNRIAHTGNGMAVPCFLSNQAAQKIHLIWHRNCDKNIRSLDSGFHQGIDAGAVSYNTHGIYFICNLINGICIDINQGYVCIFFL